MPWRFISSRLLARKTSCAVFKRNTIDRLFPGADDIESFDYANGTPASLEILVHGDTFAAHDRGREARHAESNHPDIRSRQQT